MVMDTQERTLYVSNLDKYVSEELLYELFLQAGPVERVTIPKASSYGFVTYKHVQSIEYAIELYRGTQLFKRELSVKRRTQGVRPQFNYDSKHEETWVHNSSQDMRPQFSQDQWVHGSYQDSRSHHMDRNQNLSQNSLQGHWSNRNRPVPYNRDNRTRDKDRRAHGRSHDRNYSSDRHHRREHSGRY